MGVTFWQAWSLLGHCDRELFGVELKLQQIR